MSIANLTERLERLDDLIINLTKPPVTVQLRNQVWLVVQDFEAVTKTLEKILGDVETAKRASEHQQAIAADLQTQLAELNKIYAEFQAKHRRQDGQL